MASDDKKIPVRKSSNAEVEAFLRKVAAVPVRRAAGERGRLLFALDATASRQPTWDHASRIQGEMFSATDDLGGLGLGETATLDDLGDLGGKLGLDQHLVGIMATEVGVDVGAALFDIDHDDDSLTCCSTALSRSRILSRSGLGVAMPLLEFFWKQ